MVAVVAHISQQQPAALKLDDWMLTAQQDRKPDWYWKPSYLISAGKVIAIDCE